MARTQSVSTEEARNIIDVTGVKVVFCDEGEAALLLGELITDWIRSHPDHADVRGDRDPELDSEFHCLTITLLYSTGRPSLPSGPGA